MRDQKSAVDAACAQYMKGNASCHTAAARVSEKRVSETAEMRRARTLTPKPSISTAVKRVGTAYAEKPYPAASVRAMSILVLSRGAPYCEGRKGKSRIDQTIMTPCEIC